MMSQLSQPVHPRQAVPNGPGQAQVGGPEFGAQTLRQGQVVGVVGRGEGEGAGQLEGPAVESSIADEFHLQPHGQVQQCLRLIGVEVPVGDAAV